MFDVRQKSPGKMSNHGGDSSAGSSRRRRTRRRQPSATMCYRSIALIALLAATAVDCFTARSTHHVSQRMAQKKADGRAIMSPLLRDQSYVPRIGSTAPVMAAEESSLDGDDISLQKKGKKSTSKKNMIGKEDTAAVAKGKRSRSRSSSSSSSSSNNSSGTTNSLPTRRRKSTTASAPAVASKESDADQPPPKRRRRRQSARSRRDNPGAWYQREEMVSHRLLTLEEDLDYGMRIQKATQLRAELALLAEERRLERENSRLNGSTTTEDDEAVSNWILREGDEESQSELFLPSDEELFELGMSGSFDTNVNGAQNNNNNNGDAADSDSSDEMLLLSEESGFTILEQESEAAASSARSYVGIQEGSRFASDPMERDLSEITDEDVVTILDVSGGKDEVRHIFRRGAEARKELMRSNLRLVVSIAKKWIKGSAGAANTGRRIRDLYAGGWDRPSLDEVIQEGIVGLARAVDKYDYTKGFRFSTYSTYWITNYVRLSFKTAKTGPLRVPAHLYDLTSKYKRLMVQLKEEEKPIPSPEEVAEMLGATVDRLATSLRVTQPLLSIDQPVGHSGGARSKGSGAGEFGGGSGDICIADTLICREPRPEELVELSFLRQCLENALAAELSPHERDVVRLRLGLDDGRSRTAREVAEVCGGDLGLSAADVRRAERRAFKKLSSPSAVFAYNLKDYLHVAGIGGLENYEFKPYR